MVDGEGADGLEEAAAGGRRDVGEAAAARTPACEAVAVAEVVGCAVGG